jgi:isoquinoline 1-oxidoreductase alpha subunit
MTVSLSINGTEHRLDVPDEMPLLWAIREVVGLTGTKYGCGVGVCGACTILLDGAAERSCAVPVSEVGTRKITTIEHVGAEKPHPVQQSWVEHNIPQCGYCQPGFIIQVIDLLTNSPQLGDDEIVGAISNICRCGTYPRMRVAIAEARARLTAK